MTEKLLIASALSSVVADLTLSIFSTQTCTTTSEGALQLNAVNAFRNAVGDFRKMKNLTDQTVPGATDSENIVFRYKIVVLMKWALERFRRWVQPLGSSAELFVIK
jgi:hypothetical protein